MWYLGVRKACSISCGCSKVRARRICSSVFVNTVEAYNKAVFLGWGETESIDTMITTEPLYQPRTRTMMLDADAAIQGMRTGGETEVLCENRPQRHFLAPEMPHGLAWD
jgi:hypothetical protein